MRVLIVDDCELSAGMLAVVLEIYGHKVQLCRSPNAGVRAAGDFRPEMVLLAISSPAEAAELDAAEQLRCECDVEPLLFALCQAPGELDEAEQAVFDRVFPRPVRFGQLKPYLEKPLRVQRPAAEPVRNA
ncbi:MAG TPA: hypothetical protein VMF30_17670 [Pirellulales bacterium]|nr:hypothetical protein [Pirellulales bacterium]